MPDTSTAVFFAGLAIAAVIAKYVLSASGGSGGATSSSAGQETGPRPVTEDMISVVSVLVPHIDREAIRKDLEETHSVEATSRRLLAKKPTQKSGGSSLLDKYNVGNGEPAQPAASSSATSSDTTWVDDRKQREERFKRQRQEMVLRARQRTLELEQKKAQGGSA